MSPIQVQRRGVMMVISSPSGTGKSTIARNLMEHEKGKLELSISVTTRERRGSEIDGQHYHFITVKEFERLRDSDALLEWAEVHGNFYGTPRDAVETAMGEGRDMLFDIDYQGGQQLIAKMRADVISVFLLPPSMEELQSRLVRRAEDTAEVISERLANAREELTHWREYDYVVINEDLNDAFHQVHSILIAERLRRDRRPGLFEFESGLLT